jgi:hypothetical protein
MNAPIDHHFMPAFFLAQWADGSGKLVEYTIKHGKVIAKPVGPRATGYADRVAVWDGSGDAYQTQYEAIRKPEDPPTFDEYLALRDPLTATKVSVNMIVKVFDNEILGKHLNNMTWGVIDVGHSPYRFLLSDRAAVFANLNNADGVAYFGPTKIFVAVNTPDRLQQLRKLPLRDIVHNSNRFLVGRARRFVWAHDQSQRAFISKHMSQRMAPTPLFLNIGLP